MRIDVSSTAGGALVVKLEGAVDRETVPGIRGQLLRCARKKGVRDVDVDLSSVSFIDTAGLAVLVELVSAVSNRGHVVRLKEADENIERKLRLASVDKLFVMQGLSKSGT